MDNTELMNTWCRMWNDDATLAHVMMTAETRQWSGQSDRLDHVVGPHQQEVFVARYQRERANRFTPRLLVDGGDRMAYLWEMRKPDGSVVGGVDVNVVRDGRVVDNWTIAGARSLRY